MHRPVHHGVAGLLEGLEGLVLDHLLRDRGAEYPLDREALLRGAVEDVAAVPGDDEGGLIGLVLAPDLGADAVAELGRLEQAQRQLLA